MQGMLGKKTSTYYNGDKLQNAYLLYENIDF